MPRPGTPRRYRLLLGLTLLGLAAPARADDGSASLRHPGCVHQMKTEPGIYIRKPIRAFGTENTVRLFRAAALEVRETFPNTPVVVVGDLSYRGGGRMRPHRSHRDGRDIDVSYYLERDRPPIAGLLPGTEGARHRRHFARARASTLDVPRTWALLHHMLQTDEVEYIFVSYRLQRVLYRHAARQGLSKRELRRIFQWPRHYRNRVGIIRFERGHEDHFHIRFKPIEFKPIEAPASQRSTE